MSDGLILGVMIVLIVPLFIVFISALTHSFSGWRTLAHHYAYEGVLPPKPIKFQSGVFYFTWIYPTHYFTVLHIAVDEKSLYMSIFKPFGFFEKKLRIPFEDIVKKDEIKTSLFSQETSIKLYAQQCPKVTFMLNQKLTKRIESKWAALNEKPA